MHHEQSAAFAAGAAGAHHRRAGRRARDQRARSDQPADRHRRAATSTRTPAVFITGQVNRHELKGDRADPPARLPGDRHRRRSPRPITKAAWQVHARRTRSPSASRRRSPLAVSGRPGPVLLDIPMDVQGAVIEPAHRRPAAWCRAPPVDARRSRRLLDGARARASVRSSSPAAASARRRGRPCCGLCSRQLARAGGAARCTGWTSCRTTHPLRVGMIGSYGNRWANHGDRPGRPLLVLGSRLDIRQTGADTDVFKGDRTIFHVDCEPGEINHRVDGLPARVVGDCARSSSGARADAASAALVAADWHERARRELRAQWPDTAELRRHRRASTRTRSCTQLSPTPRAAGAFVADVGQHQMWAAQSLELARRPALPDLGRHGRHGLRLCRAAIGVAIAAPGDRWC